MKTIMKSNAVSAVDTIFGNNKQKKQVAYDDNTAYIVGALAGIICAILYLAEVIKEKK